MNWTDELLGLLGFRKRSLVGRWADRLVEAVSLAAGSIEGATGRAGEVAHEARRRTEAGLRGAGERARAGRDAVSERLDSISRRTAEIRERRRSHRERRRTARTERRQQRRRLTPIQLEGGRADRIVVRGRRPVNVRFSGGGMVRYRYYRHPSFARRVLLHLTGRQVWPRR